MILENKAFLVDITISTYNILVCFSIGIVLCIAANHCGIVWYIHCKIIIPYQFTLDDLLRYMTDDLIKIGEKNIIKDLDKLCATEQ